MILSRHTKFPQSATVSLSWKRTAALSPNSDCDGRLEFVSAHFPRQIESSALLQQLYGNLTISAEDYAEVVVSGARIPGSSETSTSPWIQMKHVTHPADITAAQQRFGLGPGELSTLILAKEIGADLVILDYFGARKLAQREGFRVQGSIAILEASFRKGYLSDLQGAYEQLLKRGVFLNREILNRSLQSFRLAPI